jgi:hypothetical protein
MLPIDYLNIIKIESVRFRTSYPFLSYVSFIAQRIGRQRTGRSTYRNIGTNKRNQ